MPEGWSDPAARTWTGFGRSRGPKARCPPGEGSPSHSRADRQRGTLNGEDRKGTKLSFPLTSLAVGVVQLEPGAYHSHMEVSAAAAEAKKQAKRIGGNNIFVERRSPRPSSSQ